jgi:hypothetical protein
MKKVLLLSILAIVLISFSSFKEIKFDSFTKNTSLKKFYPQQQTVDAYVMWGGNWRSGRITYSTTQQGYKPISYQFEDYGNSQLAGQFFPDQRFMALNSNNQFAKQYNFTHTISVQGATAYLTIY